jgi:RecA-family ATPase
MVTMVERPQRKTERKSPPSLEVVEGGGRPAPHNLDAEMELLGAGFIDNRVFDRSSAFLEPHHFYDPLHQQIYTLSLKLIAAGTKATPITLRTFFENAEPINATTTVVQYLGKLAANVTSIINAESCASCARIIVEVWRRRELFRIGQGIADAALDAPANAEEQISEAEIWLGTLSESHRGHRQNRGPICAASLDGKPVPPREWEVTSYVPKQNVALFSANGAVGKSLLLEQLGACKVVGRPWLGLHPKPGSALYLNAEDDDDELHRRLNDIARHLGLPLSRFSGLHLWSLAGDDALLATADERNNIVTPLPRLRDLRRRLEIIRPELTILDPLADLFGGNENVKPQARQFVGLMRGLAIEFNTTVILAGHPSMSGMASGTGASGNTGWGNSVRSRIYMERVSAGNQEPDEDARVMRKTKANYGREGDEIRFRYADGVFVLDSETTAGSAHRASTALIVEQLFLELLKKFECSGIVVSANLGPSYAPARMVEHPEAASIDKKLLQSAMYRLLDGGRIKVITEGPPTKRRSRLVLA